MATYVAPSTAIVHEVLKKDNYEYWSSCMKSYLELNDLWETIALDDSNCNAETESTAWKKKNLAALHAIQVSCGPEFFSEIKNISLAKDAWATLANSFTQESDDSEKQGNMLIPSMGTYVAPNTAIVPEFLKTDNYEYWSACMRSYLRAQDLWETIDPGRRDPGRQYKEWERKNSAALHAIQISCGPQFFPEIMYENYAKYAWKTLENEFYPEPKQQPQLRVPAEPIDDQLRAQKDEMMDHITKGDWKGLKAMLDKYPGLINARIAKDGSTALHKAVRSGQLRVVEGLVGLMRPDYFEIMDNYGLTALGCAACTGNTEMARCMIRKNNKLAEIGRGILWGFPLSVACSEGHKDTAIYLYTKTSIDFLSQENGKRASNVLRSCIYGKTLDIALDLLHRLPDSCKMDVIRRSDILYELSGKPEVFRSGLGLAFWQRWIYWCQYPSLALS